VRSRPKSCNAGIESVSRSIKLQRYACPTRPSANQNANLLNRPATVQPKMTKATPTETGKQNEPPRKPSGSRKRGSETGQTNKNPAKRPAQKLQTASQDHIHRIF